MKNIRQGPKWFWGLCGVGVVVGVILVSLLVAVFTHIDRGATQASEVAVVVGNGPISEKDRAEIQALAERTNALVYRFNDYWNKNYRDHEPIDIHVRNVWITKGDRDKAPPNIRKMNMREEGRAERAPPPFRVRHRRHTRRGGIGGAAASWRTRAKSGNQTDRGLWDELERCRGKAFAGRRHGHPRLLYQVPHPQDIHGQFSSKGVTHPSYMAQKWS